ncbi:MAG: DNA polymerase III subunit beta [Oscillospiraceae bacterium]|nr:DNA polymerase III subunit beta [Oscillospiraceae bacterium]
MKFSCEKALLLSAAVTASRAVIQKSNIPALEGILIEAKDGLFLTGYNLETGIRTAISADIPEKGAIVLSARTFTDIIRSMPDDFITISSDENFNTKLKCKSSEFNIVGMDPGEYPELPVTDMKNSFSIEEGKIKALIGQTIFSASDNETRPVYTGELFEIEDSTLTVVALDGYRVALRKDTVTNNSGAAFSFIVPGSALKEVDRISSDTDSVIEVRQGSKHVVFQFENVTLISRLLEGEFLDYKNAIPRKDKTVCTFDRDSLKAAVERVSVIISDETTYPIRCTFSDRTLKMKVLTTIGSAYDECEMDADAGDTEIGFNSKYLLDAIKSAHCDTLKIEVGTSVTPVVIVPAEGEENFLYMILPVRLKTV